MHLLQQCHIITRLWFWLPEDADKQIKLKLVRGTKGLIDKEALRFEHEKLKITCAERYYRTLGILITARYPTK